MIPKNIKREHIIKAIEAIERYGAPKGRNSKRFLLEFKRKYYPPKYIISLANKYANGEELDPSEFSGGKETNDFLKNLDFNIVDIPGRKTIKLSNKQRETRLSGIHYDERCPKCKETIKNLIEKIYGKVEVNYKFNAGTHLEDFKDTPHYHKLKEIYEALQYYRGFKEFIKAKTLPNCDFFVPNPGFIVEFDESQHFTIPRKITLERYPSELELEFSREKWIKLCEEINTKDNDPPHRDEQRAWYDTLRDFLPVILGLKPTVRLFAKDFAWCSLNPEKASDVEKFKSRLFNQTSKIKVVLCVPITNQTAEEREEWENEVRMFAKEKNADLIVFPEGYISASNFDDAKSKVRDISIKMRVAVLSGVEAQGYQLAVFCNLKSKNGETKEHIYIKHSSAKKLAYEWPKYKGKHDKMFDPIILRRRKIGVMICHDMFFPLIPHTLVNRGAEILIDLTGGNVNFKKWKNIIRGRSLEIRGLFLCTMGYNRNGGGRSSCIAYENGRKIPFYYSDNGKDKKSLNGPEPPGFCMVIIPPDEDENEEQPFSSKTYSDITISLNRDKEADLEIIKINNEPTVLSCGKELHPDEDGWIKVKKRNGVIGLLTLPLKEILNPVAILKCKPKTHIDYYFVLYYGQMSASLTPSNLIALAKLRAIENRVGILIFSDGIQIALKTTKYKNIQRVKGKNRVFGFNKESLGGPESIFTQGVPIKFKDKYFGLLNRGNNR